MRFVILSQYFPPEIGAPQNRLYELAVRLQKAGIAMTILTAMPNYPSMEIHADYRRKIFAEEQMDGMRILRSWIYVSKSKSFIHRILNYYSFVFTAFFVGVFKLKKHDYILCESPPLFLGKTAWLLSVLFGSKFIFNVSDLWPESAEKLGLVKNKTILKVATWMEEFFYKKSTLITGQTQGIVKNIQERFPYKKVYWLPNGVDIDLFIPKKDNVWRNHNNFETNDFLCIYAGIIGYAQGLDTILEAASNTKHISHIKYILMGSGPEKERLMEIKNTQQLSNVYFFDAIKKTEMISVLSSVDATIIPLRKLDLFLGAIPSKIFENLAMKVPVLLGVDGEARTLFVEQGKCALYVEPENAEDLSNKVIQLYESPQLREELSQNGYTFVSNKFNRDKIAEEFRKQL